MIMKLSLQTLSLVSCVAALMVAAGTAHAGVVTGTAFCDIATNSGGQGSGNAILTPTIGAALTSAETASAGECASFTASAINFNTGYGNPGQSLSDFLNTVSGNILSQTYFTTPAKNGNATGSDTSGSENSDGTLFVLTGTTFLTAGESISLSHDDGALLYITGNGLTNDLISPSGSGNQTVAGQPNFNLPGEVTTGAYTFELIFNTNYEQPAELVSNINVGAAPTPEPSSIALLGTGLLAAAGAVRRRLVK